MEPNTTTTTVDPKPAAASTPAAATPPAAEVPAVVGTPKGAEGFQSRLRRGASSTAKEPAATETTPATTPEPKKKEEAAPKAGEKKETPAATETPAAAAPAKRVIKRAAGFPEATPIAEAATKLGEVADRMTETLKNVTAPKAAPAAPTVELTDAEKREIAVLAEMEEIDPKYKGIAQRSEKFLADLPTWQSKWEDKFRDDWERKNEGKEFENDEARDAAFNEQREAKFEKDQAAFRKRYNIDFEDDDFSRATVSLETKPVREENKRLRKVVEEVSEKQKAEAVKPLAAQKGKEALEDFGTLTPTILGEDYKDVLKSDGTLDIAKLEASKDPVIIEAVDDIADVMSKAANISKEFAEATQLAFSGVSSPLFNEVAGFCVAQEKFLMSQPEATRKSDDGKMFTTRANYQRMNDAEKAKHWILDAETVITLHNDMLALKAQRAVEEEKARAKKRIERRGGNTAAPAKAAAPVEEEVEPITPAAAAIASMSKPNSPASVDALPPSGGKGGGGGGGGFIDRMKSGTRGGLVPK